jgi:hypothetical protein
MTIAYQYRLYCNTEAAYVYGYNTSTPTVCPNNNTHTIDNTTITIVQTVSSPTVSVSNLPISPFNAIATEEKTTILELKSFLGKSVLRDIFTTVGLEQSLILPVQTLNTHLMYLVRQTLLH